jgi:hypothetical protein
MANYTAHWTTDKDPVCSTRGDCCQKAKAAFRYLIASSFPDTTGYPLGGAVYPKCQRYYSYLHAADECSLYRPYSSFSLSHTPFQSIDECLGRDVNASILLNSTAANVTSASSSLDLNMNCLGPFLEAHRRCVYETIADCMTGLASPAECAADYVFFSDWDTWNDVVSGYPALPTVSPLPG